MDWMRLLSAFIGCLLGNWIGHLTWAMWMKRKERKIREKMHKQYEELRKIEDAKWHDGRRT